LYCRYFKRELFDKGGIDRKQMPKLFRAYFEDNEEHGMFTPQQQKGFTDEERTSCPWYLECPKKWTPSSEEGERASQSSALSVEKVSEEEEIEEAEDVSTAKKKGKAMKESKDNKGTKEGKKKKDASGGKKTKGSSSKDKGKQSSLIELVASPVSELPPPRRIDVVTVADGGGSPTDIISVSTDIFAPSQIQVMSLDQADNQVIEASVLLLCSSIQHMVEYGAKEKKRSPDFI